MAVTAPIGGDVIVNGDTWHDYIGYANDQLWQSCVSLTGYIGAIDTL